MVRGDRLFWHQWSGGPFIPDMDSPGGPIMGGTIGSMTGLMRSQISQTYHF